MTDAFRWRDNDLDNALMLGLASDAPSEAHVRALVSQGADVNSVKNDESVLMEALFFTADGLDERFIHLLMELGADVNFISNDGGCPLGSAISSANPALAENLLQRGANPNVVYDYTESLLEAAEFDLRYRAGEAGGDADSPNGKRCRALEEIIGVLKRHGAKRLSEYDARQASRWLQVFGCYRTGLLTSTGYLNIESIDGLTDSFRSEFLGWKRSFWDSWPEQDWSSQPTDFDRRAHNEWATLVSGDPISAFAAPLSCCTSLSSQRMKCDGFGMLSGRPSADRVERLGRKTVYRTRLKA